jgi:hypothetical protein
MPATILKKTLESITEKEAKDFQGLLDETKHERFLFYKQEKWNNVEGGTDRIFNDLYQDALKYVLKEKLHEKKDEASEAKILENIILGAMRATKDSDSLAAAEVFSAADKAGEFKSLTEKVEVLLQYANTYLSINPNTQQFQQIRNQLRSGDKYEVLKGMKTITETLKESVIKRHFSKKYLKVATGNEPKLTAYMIDHIKKEYKIEPIFLGKELMKGPAELLEAHKVYSQQKYAEKVQYKSTDYKEVEEKKAA